MLFFYYIIFIESVFHGYYTLKSSFKTESEENGTKKGKWQNKRITKRETNEKLKLVLYVDCWINHETEERRKKPTSDDLFLHSKDTNEIIELRFICCKEFEFIKMNIITAATTTLKTKRFPKSLFYLLIP